MIDAGHRACVEAALNHEKADRTPVNNFALVTAARSAGIKVDEARWNPQISAKVSVDYALKTKSDFIKPILDRDTERYQRVVDARVKAGKARGEQMRKEA
ncbi:MAG: hypothetical protein IKA98_04870, partial [Candidatus Methanomethylophilaceae archaeon]|nr:hypothetical protein [Candidatus Methanomethylophilaceae archaeon]